jgi:hypothetical protein
LSALSSAVVSSIGCLSGLLLSLIEPATFAFAQDFRSGEELPSADTPEAPDAALESLERLQTYFTSAVPFLYGRVAETWTYHRSGCSRQQFRPSRRIRYV